MSNAPRIMRDEFSIARGSAQFHFWWSGVISPEDVADLKAWLHLIERRLDRLPTVGPNEEAQQ